MSGTAAAVDKLKSMRDAYQQKLPREIQHVRSLWNNLLYVKWNKESFTLLQRLVHNLAGTAGTYGFPEVSAVAARLDQRLQELGDGGQPPTEHDRARISGRLQNLEDIANDSRQLEVLEAGASLRVLWECGVQYIQGNFLQTPSSEMNFLFNEQAG
jgi:HPt (histidine-containing phosphotransfer) domain-containing protein